MWWYLHFRTGVFNLSKFWQKNRIQKQHAKSQNKTALSRLAKVFMPCIGCFVSVSYLTSLSFCMKVNHLIISSLTQDEHEINILFQERTYLSIDLCLFFLRYFLRWCKKFHENPSKQYCETESLTAPSDAAWTLALGRVPFFHIATQTD